jgi:hypothetical protein
MYFTSSASERRFNGQVAPVLLRHIVRGIILQDVPVEAMQLQTLAVGRVPSGMQYHSFFFVMRTSMHIQAWKYNRRRSRGTAPSIDMMLLINDARRGGNRARA